MNLQINKYFPSLNKLKIDPTKTVYEIFVTNFKSVNPDEIKKIIANKKKTMKNAAISKNQRHLGNGFFNNNNYKEALNYYHLSLQFANFESLDYMLALADRTKAHYALKKYRETLIDIERILRFPTFPKELLSSLYIRQSQCLIYFKEYAKALIACNNASNNLEFVEPRKYEVRKDFIKTMIYNINRYQNVATVANEPQLPKLLLKDGENPKYLDASNAVKIKYNDLNRKGRHVIAKTAIKPGDILFIERPYCAVRNDNSRVSMRYCSYCFRYCETTIPCKYCITHFYCTEKCRYTSWNNEHRWICYGEMNNLLGATLRLTLNIIFKAARSNFQTIFTDLSIYGDRINNFPHVFKLATNKQNMTKPEICEFTKLAIWLVVYLIECTDFFQYLLRSPAYVNSKKTDLYECVGAFILHISMQLQCNTDEIINTTIDLQKQHLKTDNIGLGLYVSCAMMNHSCLPNTRSTYEQTLRVVRATKRIPKNTEITIDYLEGFDGVPDKAKFFRNYKFTCTCSNCTNPLRIEKKPWLCGKCHGKAYNVTENQAKCTNCNIIFSLKSYKHIEDSLEVLFLFPSVSAIENIHRKMKKIYHKDNIKFACYLNFAYEFHSDEANISKFVEICRELVQISNKYNDICPMKLHAYLKFLRATGMKCFFMRLELLPEDKTCYNEFQEMKQKGVNMLQYFVSTEQVNKYKKYIHDFLDPSEQYQ